MQLLDFMNDWELEEHFLDKVVIDDFTIHLSGFIAQNKAKGISATGSAGELHDQVSANEKGYYELLERIGVQQSYHYPQKRYDVSDMEGSYPYDSLTQEQIFPESTEPEKWKYSFSNGVALHTDFKTACKNALYERIERDLFLKVWYKEYPAALLSYDCSNFIKKLNKYYDFKEVCFGAYQLDEEKLYSVGIFGFPKTEKDMPFVYGLGADVGIQQSFEKAESEFIQRLGFLYGESADDELESFQPNAYSHQEYYLKKQNYFKIKKFIEENMKSSSEKELLYRLPQTGFVSLTPEELLDSNYYLVKCVSNELMPLTFGVEYPWADHHPESRNIHPIA